MAPWSRNRKDKASERDLQKKAKTQDARTTTPPVPVARAKDDAADSVQSSPRRARRNRDSVVSLSAVNDPPSMLQSPPLLDIPESLGRNQNKRFSLMRFRHASDSHLSKTAKEHADAPAIPIHFNPPSIIATAPTSDINSTSKRRSTLLFARRNKDVNTRTLFSPEMSHGDNPEESQPALGRASSSSMQGFGSAPPPYEDASATSLAIPINRASESDASSGEHGVFARTTTTHTISTTTTFFKLPRRKKDKGPLFPLPAKAISANASLGGTPRLSAAESGSSSPGRHYFDNHPEQSSNGGSPRRPRALRLSSTERSNSRASQRSARASSTLARASGLNLRGRSSTMNSATRKALGEEEWIVPTPQFTHSTRTSTSTAGRPSLAGLFSLNRTRQSSEPLGRSSHGGPDTPGSIDSRMESRMPPIVIPERQEGDTAAKYLARLEEVVHRSALVAIISKTDDEFMKNVLRSFMRRFSFFEYPLDMAVRNLLMHVELPKETQQIDRTLQAFADRYHECNPGIFPDADHAYFCAFSIMMLHTDAFNKNNKRKMQKADYIKHAREQSGVSTEVMDCFYDNIVYTPFIHLEDDVTIPKQQNSKTSRKSHKNSTTPLKKQSSGPIDPYTLILDGQLEVLRPNLREILPMEDPFNFTGTLALINVAELNRSFLKYGVLQILSSRSRPGAFMNQATITNPAEAQIGVVDMKVTKVGVLWRKDPKKKKARSPWQEWGAVLTPSQLYLFRNTSWVKTLMHQFDTHSKVFKNGPAVVFKPPLEEFRPDFALSMDDVVTLVDSEYKKHKHAFFFTRSTSFQEVFLADNESELNDWIARINFAATYRTTGVRMRAAIGSDNPVQEQRQTISRSSSNTKDDASGLKVPSAQSRKDDNLMKQVMEARTEIMRAKLNDAIQRRDELDKSIQTLQRLSRQMCVLTPIQEKTKEAMVEGTLRLATHIRWTRIEYCRVQCHHDVLKRDLDLDNAIEESTNNVNNKNELTPQTTREEKGRLGFSRLSSRAGSGTTSNTSGSRSRPTQQLSGRQLFSMDDIFRSPSRTRQSQHKAKGSWELPPLSFDRGRSVSSSRASKPSSRRSSDVVVDRISTRRSDSLPGRSISSRSGLPNTDHIDDDHQALVAAGILPPDSAKADADANVEVDDEEKAKVPELDDREATKVRHSYQGKLHKVHIPTPSRARKHRDSMNSSTVSDDNTSVDGSEVLARGPGKFTVHGKKASVITFGSDWADMNPEERMRARSSTQPEEMVAGNEPLEETSTAIKETVLGSRPSSSHSTVRHDSAEFVTPTEDHFPDIDSPPSQP